jgi:hypothetical protein
LCALAAIIFAAGAPAQGPVMLIGDAADDHGPPNVYAGLLQEVLSNAANGQTGILALGVDSGSDAANWITSVSALLPQPQPIAFVNDKTVGLITFSGYAALYVPSNSAYTSGGISAVENALLTARASDVADFLDAGGGLFALTQGQFEDAYGWLGDFAPVDILAVGPSGYCGEENLFADVGPSEAGLLFGITATNLDGCCWGNIFTTFPEFLAQLAVATEPNCPELDGGAVILTGFVDLPDVNFDPPDVTLADGEPNVEAVGNLDGDVNDTVDVVAVIPNEDPSVEGSIQVFLNQGNDQDGVWIGLMANAPIMVGRNPSSVAVGLFDADQDLDLAVTNANDDTVSILINQGDGSFDVISSVAVGDAPSSVVTADFNADMNTDLAVTNEGDDNVVILFGDGAGNFTLNGGGGSTGLIGFSAGDGPLSMLSDDFDNDDDVDLSGSSRGSRGTLAGDTGIVFVLLGNGDGTFEATTEYAVGVNPTDVTIADLDGDGFPDIAASNSADGTVSILINLGGGTFAPAFTIQTGQNPVSVDAVDLNGDGDPDLTVVADDLQIGPAVQVFENRLDGGDIVVFDEPVAFSVNADPNFVSNGDFNNDGFPDLVTVNEDEGGSGGSVSVLINNPAPVPCPGDFNGDGYVNVVDMLELLASWGPCDAPCPADLNGDGVVNVLDFLDLLFQWGICAAEGECPWDLTGDGVVNGLDIAELMQNIGPCDDPANCPWDLDGDGTVGLLDLWALLLHIGDCQ